MKKKLLFLSLFIASTITFSQVTAGQVDDFEDGTVQNWIIGAGGASAPMNVATGGPAGVDDNFLEYTSLGGSGIASRMAIFNANNQWSGNFTAQNVVEIQLDVEALTNDLYLRLAFQGPGGTRMISSSPVVVTAGSGWTPVALSLAESDFIIVQGANTVADVLAGALTMRIISVRDENIDNWRGEAIAATIRVDNITASTTLNREQFDSKTAFTIYPNPSRSRLNISMPTLANNTKVEVYNILGSRVYNSTISKLNTSINVSQWNSGVYLVRVSTDKETITKRFVKQ